MYKIILVGLVLFAYAAGVSAHVSGQSVERAVGDYVVDIGFDELIEAGKATRFDFSLWDKNKIEQIRYDRIWVRVSPPEGIVLATYITTPSFGLAGMSYSFSEAGDYEITVRFERGDETLAEISFPVSVMGPLFSKELSNYGIAVGIGLVAGFIGSFFLRKKKQPDI